MLLLVVFLLACSAILGLLILKNWFTSTPTGKTVVYGHGILAVLALAFLLIHVMSDSTPTLRFALWILGLAAAAGIYMFLRDLKGHVSPMWLAVLHAGVAVIGVVLLIVNLI